MEKEHFLTRDRDFYKTLFPLLITVALQNIVAYSVNMVDNLMLGSYSQNALSGAATVNQIFFVVQQISIAVSEGLVVLGSQYYGQERMQPVRRITGIALKLSLICGLLLLAVCILLPRQVIGIFTTDAAIIDQGVAYLRVIQFTFVLFLLTNTLMAALRCVGTVRISFLVSVVSLVINVCINYCLIFGRFGLPELGILGASIGTLAARIVELAIVIVYMAVKDRKLRLFSENFLKKDSQLRRDYTKVEIPVMLSQVLWAVSVPMQTAILGHLSSDAIAANSVATTFYQYLKVIVVAMSSSSAVMIGRAIGCGDMKKIREEARTLSVIDVCIGLILGLALLFLRKPLLSLYSLSDNAMTLADQLIIVMSGIMVGMSYQMPVSMGIIRGGGDTTFTMYMNIISTWCIVMPLSFMSAFWWKWPVFAVVIMIQSDQVFKGLPTFIRFHSYKWIKKLTREDA